MLRVRLLLVLCVVVWGWTFVATKICLAYVNPLEVVGLRFLIGLPILFAIVLLKGTPLSFARADALPLAVGSGIITLHFLIQATALRYTSATHTGWIIAVSPLAIAVMARVLLGERTGRRLWTGIAAATAGLAILVSKGRIASLGWLENPGDWMVLLSALTWAAYTIATRDLSRSRDPLVVTLVVYLPLLVVCAASMLISSRAQVLFSLPLSAILALVFLGVFGTAAQWWWQVGIARIGAARAGVFLYLEPVATTALAVPLLGESYGLFTGVGGLLILGGVWWAERPAGDGA